MAPAAVTSDVPFLLVYEDVVPPTENGEIVEIGRPAFRPGLSVMNVEKRGAATARECAVMVTPEHLATQPARDLASLTTYANRSAIRFEDQLNIAVA